MTGDTDIHARLKGLIAAHPRRRAVTEAAADLLARLDAPVRVVVYGLPGSGKTDLINSLLGRPVLPAAMPLPTLTLEHGAAERCTVVLSDGTQRSFDGLPFARIAAAAPLLVEIALPDPALLAMKLTKIAADATTADQAAAMAWAAGRTDIAIWCSHGFDAGEAAIWAAAPEALKHNGYLVQKDGAAATGGDFVASFNATADAAALKAELQHCADRGRQALHDHALLFLSRYEQRSAARSGPNSRPIQPVAPAPEALSADPRPPAGPAPEAAPIAPADPAPGPAAQPVAIAAAAPAPAAGTAKARAATARNAADPAPAKAAIWLLQDRARDLSAALPKLGAQRDASVFGHCLETVALLVERFGSGPERSAPIEDLILDVADNITLLEAEGGAAQATESVTLLLQLRRDLEMQRAA